MNYEPTYADESWRRTQMPEKHQTMFTSGQRGRKPVPCARSLHSAVTRTLESERRRSENLLLIIGVCFIAALWIVVIASALGVV